jgi:hypothetical protein
MANHGVYVTQNATSVSAPTEATSGIPFVIGTAPLTGTATAGTPVLATTYDAAVEAVGYDDSWSDYTLSEFIYSQFKLFGCQPVILLPLAKGATKTDVAAAVEKIELCLTMFGIVPDLILAPGFSNEADVAAAMSAKADSINGMFKGIALVDIKSATATAAVTAKNSGSYNSSEIVCWPCGKVGDLVFHMSTIIAGRISATDTDNDGVPYESPSNKSVPLDGVCTEDGTEILLSKGDADILNNAGIVTALNFMGSFVAWGNYTGTSTTDVKDKLIPINRMFSWVNNTLIQTFWSQLDAPMNNRLAETILDTCNIWINGLVGSGYLLGGRVELNEAENPTTNLMAGIIKLHVYLTPPSPAQEIDFVLEYDADYVTEVFSS